MELWIRSQDKMTLVKIEEINVNYQNNKQIIANYKVINSEDEDYQILGTYKTKERALEVLDEIQDILKPKTIIKFKNEPMYDDKNNFMGDRMIPSNEFDYTKQLNTYVYEMPKE